MIRSLTLSIAQLTDPPVLRVLAKSFAVTLIVFVALAAGFWAAARGGAGWLGAGTGWQELAGFVAVLLAIGGAWLLFRAVAIAVVGVFADEVVEAVERRHYPQALATAKPVPFARGLAMGLGSAARTVLVNLVLLPVYLALLVTGVGPAILFFLVNGWLLGRDLGDMVAARHMPKAAMRDWRATTGVRRFVLGLVGTGLLVVPVANILAPVVAAAMATHWYHQRKRA
ncbi:EI24 domain-containing protein [Sphingomonas sp. S1-29]|uniref:EI24 domain-containing protein n=1 Tax=Sphingomonas sp. S1-29 TaxID=2991074 RepID=UPI00223F14BD|nr:EI24 domain-containing protein [Sphingomonas sp. S1-29]UZK70849.1 EI24 domain-containing protein [Sphingomonas sp. S1-29]